MRSPDLKKGEKIILWSQSTLYMKNSWQQGYLFLTTSRLIFNQVTKLTYETDLKDIIKLRIEKKLWFFGVRVKQLCVDFNSEKGQEKVYLALANPEKWKYKIIESMTLMLAGGWDYNGANAESNSNT